MEDRIHKILAHAGFGSRRSCEELIAAGRVTVNGRMVTVGDKARAGEDDIRVDGRRVRAQKVVYYLVNKPPGYLCTNSDPAGRRRVVDLLEGVRERVYPVGRLDADSRGLVLMTNDGDLAERLTHPRYEVPKTYEAEVEGQVKGEDIEKLLSGVWLSEGKTAPARVRIIRRGSARSLLEITLREGRNRQVRRMLAKLNHPVRRLMRTRIGSLTLRGLGIGKYRPLTDAEVESLRRASEPDVGAKPKRQKGKGGKKPTTGAAQHGQGRGREGRDRTTGGGRRIYDFTK